MLILGNFDSYNRVSVLHALTPYNNIFFSSKFRSAFNRAQLILDLEDPPEKAILNQFKLVCWS